MISQHLKALESSGDYSKTTISIARMWLTHFQAFCGERDPAALKTKDLEQWHKQLVWTPGPRGKLYSPNTVSQAVGAIRRLYRWLLAEGKLKKNPTETLVTSRVKKNSKS